MSRASTAHIYLTDASKLDEFKKGFAELYTNSTKNEPNTLQYELFVDDADPKHLVVIEKYATKEAQDQHVSSEAVAGFVSWAKSSGICTNFTLQNFNAVSME
eukprot:PhM_4_TR158/c0_g1_i1/m.61404